MTEEELLFRVIELGEPVMIVLYTVYRLFRTIDRWIDRCAPPLPAPPSTISEIQEVVRDAK